MGSKWLKRVGGAILIGGALVMATGSPAVAEQDPVPINGDQVPTTAQEFETHECGGPLSDLPDDQDGWHFLLPGAAGEAFVSITLTFDTPGGEVEVVIDSADPANPSTGAGWSGYLDGMHAG